jgi:ParB/RepB/Spo0J family partition protein
MVTTMTKRQRPPQTLTGQDRLSAVEIVLGFEFDELKVRQHIEGADDENDAVRWLVNVLFVERSDPWTWKQKGEPEILARKDGLHVKRDGRSGIVRYIDVVRDARDYLPVAAPPAEYKYGNNIPTQINADGARNGHDPEVKTTPGENSQAGRFGEKSTSLPDGAAAIELRSSHRPKQPAGLAKLTAVENVPTGAQLLEISTLAINPNPWQPRQDFPKAEIESFAAQITADGGLIEPIVLRLTPGTVNIYQLVDGERRLRAAKHLKWPSILAVVREYSDQQMQALALSANDARKDLNPVERAMAYQAILDARGVPPAALEAITGKSQSYISNHLRLLKLPETWQTRLAAGHITLTHARHLMPFAAQREILDAFAKNYPAGKPIEVAQEDFQQHWLRFLEDKTRPMTGTKYVSSKGRYIQIFKATDEQRAQLGVIDVPDNFDLKRSEPRATNTKLWDSIWKQHAAKAKPSDWKREQAGRAHAQPEKKKKLTPAQIKREEESERRIAAEKLAIELWTWKANWLRYLIAKRLVVGKKADEEALFLALLWALAEIDGDDLPGVEKEDYTDDWELRANVVWAVLGAGKHSMRANGAHIFLKKWIDADDPAELTMRAVRGLFWSDKGDGIPVRGLADSAVIALGKRLRIDLAAEWKREKAGPLTQALFELHSDEQLDELFVLQKFHPSPGMRADRASKIGALCKFAKLPKCILAAKEPKS